MVLDIHGNNNDKGSDYRFYGLASRRSHLAMGVAGLLGSMNAEVHIGIHSPAEFLPNFISWDL